ncbi:MAG: hemoglobin [Bacteroidetes bacterium]|nr:MAG: hemoglobin [Bacteroidota bacterium]
MNKTDILSENDIKKLVDSFYEKVKRDAVIGFFFNDVAKVNWDMHLEKMYAFWGSVLLGTHAYHGAPFAPHYKLHQQSPMEKKHFLHWADLFTSTVDEHFAGEKAEEAKARGVQIAALWFHKISLFGKQTAPADSNT